jgi:hypothetical protein
VIVNATDPASTRAALIQPVQLIVLHHCSLKAIGVHDEDLTGELLAQLFETRTDLGTGRCRPYHVGIRVDGTVDQLISLLRRGAHALAFNASSLAVVTFGESGLTTAQRNVLPDVLADLLLLTDGVPVRGHTALGPTATRPGHPICPHPTTDVRELELVALQRLTNPGCSLPYEKRQRILADRGWVF